MITKSKLKTGMKVTTREGEEYIVLLNAWRKYSGDILINVAGDDCLYLDEYNEDLTCKEENYPHYDIVKVEVPCNLEKLTIYPNFTDWTEIK